MRSTFPSVFKWRIFGKKEGRNENVRIIEKLLWLQNIVKKNKDVNWPIYTSLANKDINWPIYT